MFPDGQIEEWLGEATPESVAKWLRVKSFGKDKITKKDKPIIRSNTVEQAKKALSWYMLDAPAWRSDTKSGNPTKSKIVNNLIRYIKQKEVRNDGQSSSAKRALTQSEFRAALTVLSSKIAFQLRYRIPTMMKLVKEF